MSRAELSADEKFKSVEGAARRILDALGHAAPDTPQSVYAGGDLVIAGDDEKVEIIYRGTLVFRTGPQRVFDEHSFTEESGWLREVERVAQSLPGPPPSDKDAPER